MTNKNRKWNLQNSYVNLPKSFYDLIEPVSVIKPKLIYFNNNLAKELGLDFLSYDLSLATNYFSGNKIPENSKPIAQAYAGHQFGHFTMLGD